MIDGETRVSKVVEAAAKEAGAPIRITGFVRLALGEGVEAAFRFRRRSRGDAERLRGPSPALELVSPRDRNG